MSRKVKADEEGLATELAGSQRHSPVCRAQLPIAVQQKQCWLVLASRGGRHWLHHSVSRASEADLRALTTLRAAETRCQCVVATAARGANAAVAACVTREVRPCASLY